MLIAKICGHKRKYVYGGSGIFHSISTFLKGLLSTDASRAIARQAASAALDVGKTAVTTVGKKLVDKAVKKKIQKIVQFTNTLKTHLWIYQRLRQDRLRFH